MALLETEPVIITFCGDRGEQEFRGMLPVVSRHLLPGLVIRRDSGAAAGVQVCGAGACYPVIRDAAELNKLLGGLA